RQVILEEIKMYEDDPEDFAHETLILNIWPEHPLSRPITGTAASVTGITPKMLRDHVRGFYSPERLVISIAGNFDEQQAIDQVTAILEKLKRGKHKRKIAPPALNKFLGVKNKEVEQAHITIATPGLSVSDPRRYVVAILDLCLGGSVSSRLFQEVREKRGLVYTINTYRESHQEGGIFGVYAGASPKQISKVLELISEELQRTKADGFTEEEITRAKTQLRSELLLGLESMRSRSSRNAYSELYFGRQLSVEEIVDDINKVTANEVRKLASDLLTPDGLSMVVVGPKSEMKNSYTITC
ncbi:MAG: M16 family metallopeptidase, partial [Candidatus Angelobacter sp.]